MKSEPNSFMQEVNSTDKEKIFTLTVIYWGGGEKKKRSVEHKQNYFGS